MLLPPLRRVVNPLVFPLSLTFSRSLASLPGYSVLPQGDPLSLEHRIFIQKHGEVVSPWHDIPLFPPSEPPQVVRYINEISRGSRAKLEMANPEAFNPIKQDTKKGSLRFYGVDPPFNYGAIPQTWEDPRVSDEEGRGGDGDAIDVVEVSSLIMPTGTVTEVKVLGIFCLIDQGEVDWKVLAINTDSALSKEMHSEKDIDRVLGEGKLKEIVDWFVTYKTFEGKKENELGYGGRVLGPEFAMKVIGDTHELWKSLVQEDVGVEGVFKAGRKEYSLERGEGSTEVGRASFKSEL